METSLIIKTMDDAEKAARAMSASGFFADAKQASQAIVKILAGQELGFGPFASMTGVNIIQNKPVLAANLMAAAVKRTGKYNYRVTKLTDKECEITFLEDKQEVGKSAFTWADAEKAGLTNKDNWKRYPRNMLFARALSNGQKWYAPDVFNGATVYTPDELGAIVDEEGNAVIEAEEVTGNGNHVEETGKTEELVIESVVPAPKLPKAETEKPKGVIGWLIETHALNTSHAAQVANLLKLTDPKLKQPDWEKRYNNYRSLRDSNLSPEDAAKQALAA